MGDGQQENKSNHKLLHFVWVQVVVANYILQHNPYQKFVLVVFRVYA